MREHNVTQLQASALESVLARLLSLGGIGDLARQNGFIKRSRVIEPVQLLSSLIVCFGSGRLEWLAQIHRGYCSFSGRQIQYKAFHNRLRTKEFCSWLSSVFSYFMGFYTNTELIATRKGLREFNDILIHDGTSFALKDKLLSEYPGRFSAVSPAAVELHCTLSLWGSCPHEVTLAPDKESEVRFRPKPELLEGKLLLADRIFEDRQYFQDIKDAGGSYIIRGKKGIKPEIERAYDQRGRRQKRLEGKPLNLKGLKGKHHDFIVKWHCDDGSILRERLLVLYKSGSTVKDKFTLLHTNLLRSKYRISAIVNLYRFRWQVELFFKQCKSYANLHKFDTGIAQIAEAMIWSALITAVFRCIFIHHVQKLTRLTLSSLRCASDGFLFFRDLFEALVGRKERHERVSQIRDIMRCLTTMYTEPKINKPRTRDLIGLRFHWDFP